ncbi:beta-galactosidase [Occallatibacter riparius]|uniref:Beta-galactosidase n=1 Tax=Occallatibacter riparius TaxID=1002689 RepID=A0A9J7BKD3_9BACT|nr:beta-galactosidase [Occallatibacter riparius]UWZ81733.1 beta-galactosidase [Occallatibacter riparius]
MFGKILVLWQPGFPTVGSEPMDRAVLARALDGMNASFVDLKGLKAAGALDHADLLVLPYGSAAPVDAWSAIEHYLHSGGNLLIVGGQPLQVPVVQAGENFEQLRAQNSYAGEVGFRNTYEVPVAAGAQFKWRDGYALGAAPKIRARKFFAVEGHLDGLGYMADKDGLLVAAPVIVDDHVEGAMSGSRIVALDIEPEAGYWGSDDGIALMRTAAHYAAQGAVSLNVETLFATLRPGELPVITAHVREPRSSGSGAGELKVTLNSEQGSVDSVTVAVAHPAAGDVAIPFHKALSPGFYTVTATYGEAGQFRAYYQNGFWVEDASAIATGERVTANGDFLARDGAPYFPVGTNYFSTEGNGWDFSGPRNAAVWEHDFAEMEQHGVTFVRTGVWMHFGRFTQETAGGGANERFLRNVEAFMLCAQRHHIVVNFTLFAMSPRAGDREWGEQEGTLPNPYLDAEALKEEQAYARSVVERFKDAPFVTWDLINEPSFSNPRVIFKGNVPNGDGVEVAAWHKWLREKYSGDLRALADAWSLSVVKLGSFDDIPLPAQADLSGERYGNSREIRALDYNLFAQDMFSNWVKKMVVMIRSTGSTQLINVGQDEGGVTDRVLNQFYGGAGVSFTTNHTYWQDDALLWDSIAAKRPGLANITGETGFQPVWYPDGTWRYNEFTGLGLTLRKWALGFAAGSSGAVQWDWAREADFGMKRSDGSSKTWENQMRALGEFAKKAAPAATSLIESEVAIVLPQSLQLSVENHVALEAQQNAVRALYGYARSQAYAVGEYQIELLGHPKLILLPAPMGMTEKAWQGILDRVKAGATLLVTGPFDGDAHLHATGRAQALGISYSNVPLTIREQLVKFPWREERVSFGGMKTTTLTQGELADGTGWMEKKIGSGRILFSPVPLELSDDLEVVGSAYEYALKAADVAPVYSTALTDPGILIAPTVFPKATMYVITSESNQGQVTFTDVRSGKTFRGMLDPGSAAIVLVGTNGNLNASWNWSAQ